MEDVLEKIKSKAGFIIDMDGVIYHGNKLLPGVIDFLNWLEASGKKYLFLTNSSERTPKELHEKLKRLGIDVGEEHFYTSALATASFLANQKPNGSAYIIGDAGLIHALYSVGYSVNNVNPDYVVVGDTHGYNFEKVELAVNLVIRGAKLIGTNSDIRGAFLYKRSRNSKFSCKSKTKWQCLHYRRCRAHSCLIQCWLQCK